jgi:hypothetical protein
MIRFIGLFDITRDDNLQFTVTRKHTPVSTVTSSGQSQSYVTTDGQSTICLGVKHPSGAYDYIFITVRQL